MLNVFINTWGNYNENGVDGGEWVTLPMTEEELTNTLQQIADNMGDLDPEFCIHDYEWTSEIEPRDISEYENIMALNEEINDYAILKDWEQKEIAAAMEAFGYTFTEAMNRQQRGCFTLYESMDLTEVAEHLVNECYDLPDFALSYFDFEAFGRDLGFDGYTETSYGVIIDG